MTVEEPILLSPGQLRALAGRYGADGQLDLQGFYGGWLSRAWTTRQILRDRGCIRERWLVHFSPASGIVLEAGVNSLSFPPVEFAITRPVGPVIVSDRVVGIGSTPAALWIDRAVTDVRPAPDGSETPIRTPLPDETFWEVLRVLDGRLDEESVGRLADVLRPWEYSDQVGFQETFDRKLFELDHPGNTVSYVSAPEVVDGDASLMYRCEIIAAGPAAFAERVAHPRSGTPGRDGASTFEILWVLEDASPYPMPRKSLPVETGSNPAHWPDAPPVKALWTPPTPEIPSPGAFSQRVQRETLGLATRTSGVMYGFVAYALQHDGVREIVGCTMAHAASWARAELEPFLQAHLGTAQLDHRIILRPQGTGPVDGMPLMELERPVRLSLSRFVETFVQTEG